MHRKTSLKKIVIFGASGGGYILNELIDPGKAEVIAVADNDPVKVGRTIWGRKIVHPCAIRGLPFDYVVIGSTPEAEIAEQLQAMGVAPARILRINRYFSFDFKHLLERYQRSALEIEAIVTGISYTQFAVNPYFLKSKTFNFALDGQDLFYDYHIVKWIMECRQEPSPLRYCLIGLAYYSFEYDLALSKPKESAFRYAFILNAFRSNPALKADFYEHKEIFDSLLKENYFNRFYDMKKDAIKLLNEKWIESGGPLFFEPPENQTGLDFNKDHPGTLRENIEIFHAFLALLEEHGVKTVVLVPPVRETYAARVPDRFVRSFHGILADAQKKYSFQFLDYLRSGLFRDDDFFDTTHLNAQGSEKFTKMLQHHIQW